MDAELDNGHSSAIFLYLIGGLIIYAILKTERDEPNLRHIPTPGTTNYLLSYIDALRFVSECPEYLQRGYAKCRTTAFRVATWNRWLVLITGTKALEELRKSPESQVSFINAANEPDGSLYQNAHVQAVAPEFIGEIARNITQNLAFLIPSIKEEVVLALSSSIHATDSEVSMGWKELNAVPLIARMTTKVVNRVILGPTLTSDERYIQISADQACDVYGYKSVTLWTVLPRFISFLGRGMSITNRRRWALRSTIVSFISQAKESAQKLRQDEIDERPNDALSWTLSDPSKRIEDIASQLLNISITASQTITMTFAHALYHLAANPRFAAPLRKEIEQIVSREGWNKQSLDHMLNVDSFVKESMRMSNISSVSMVRKVISPFTLPDGTLLPVGTLVAATSRPRHMDATIYSSPDTFDGLRFSQLHKHQYGDNSIPNGMPFQLVTTTADFLVWGYGRHACPGRFFASVVVKMMLAYVVLHYDVRFEDGRRPKDVVVGTNLLPDPHAKMLFRKRSSSC